MVEKILQYIGLEPISSIECVYINWYIIVFFFVDDICIIYNKCYTYQVDAFKTTLFATYEMTFLSEIKWVLSICITQNRSSRQLWLCQNSYIDKLDAKFNISSTNKPKSPLPVENIVKFAGMATLQDIFKHQQKFRLVNFPVVITHLDIAHAASKLSKHLTMSRDLI